MAGSCGWVSVSAETVSGLKAILGGMSLGRGIPFPRCRLIWDEDSTGNGGRRRYVAVLQASPLRRIGRTKGVWS